MTSPFRILLSLAMGTLLATPALADTANFTLTTQNPTLAPGDSVTFNGAIVAPTTNAGSIFLLGDNYNAAGPFTLDDQDFALDTPLSLGPGQSYSGALFTLTLPASSMAAAGVYNGTFTIDFADISGGSFAEDAAFQATVPAATVTPEPGSWLLLSTGLITAGLLRRRVQPRTL